MSLFSRWFSKRPTGARAEGRLSAAFDRRRHRRSLGPFITPFNHHRSSSGIENFDGIIHRLDTFPCIEFRISFGTILIRPSVEIVTFVQFFFEMARMYQFSWFNSDLVQQSVLRINKSLENSDQNHTSKGPLRKWMSFVLGVVLFKIQIGEQLKEKFDSATEVEPRTSHSGSRRHLVPRSPTYKPHTDTDLVYLDRSPSYCEFDKKTGSLGTQGRPCNKVCYLSPKKQREDNQWAIVTSLIRIIDSNGGMTSLFANAI